MKNIRYFLWTVLILSSCAVQAMAYYHPDEGRWISRDPMEEDGGLLLYGFCNNDPMNHVDLDGGIPLDTIWDLGNVVYDLAVGDNVSLAADIAALMIPYVPAGATKLVKAAKLADVAGICGSVKNLEVTYKYIGVSDKFTRHTLHKSALKGKWWKGTQGGASKFIPGWGDSEIKSVLEKALKDAKVKGKMKPQEIDGYIFDVGSEIGASNGKMTTKIKIHINADGTNLHPFPID